MTERIVVYKARHNLTTMPRGIEKGARLPPNYYFTEEEAIAAVKAHKQAKFNLLKEEYSNFVIQLQEKYGAEIYADGTASDDTGIETWLEVAITQRGAFIHKFADQLD